VRAVVPRHKAALALAGFLALPLFFASLMAVSLAIEKAHVYEWTHAGRLVRVFHPPVASLEAKIWLLALVPPLLLVAAGWGASFLPYGLYATCGAAIVDALALTIRLGTWERHHTQRFPFGEDLIPDSSTSSLTDRGQWEHEATHTVHTLVGYTIGLAIVAALIAGVLAYRRGRRRPVVPAGSELQQTGTAPTATRL
jgi:hypothetical protein